MAVRLPRYTMEEFAQRGHVLYERDIRPRVETGNKGKIVAIDIETGEYAIADDTLTAADHLYSRVPDAQIWCICIGHRAVHRVGSHFLPEAQRSRAL